MNAILVTGGARSGKSDHAQQLALRLGGDAVTFIATARRGEGDEELEQRIARHRVDRPAAWTTVEATARAGEAVRQAATAVVVLDCLTVLSANAIAHDVRTSEGAHAAVKAEVDLIVEALSARAGTLIVVTNEVGLGVHPPTALGRWFADALGFANRRIAAIATEVVLLVCGLPVVVKA